MLTTESVNIITMHGKLVEDDDVWLCRVYRPAVLERRSGSRRTSPARKAYTVFLLLKAEVRGRYTYPDGEVDEATVEWWQFGSDIPVVGPDEAHRVQPLVKVDEAALDAQAEGVPVPASWEGV